MSLWSLCGHLNSEVRSYMFFFGHLLVHYSLELSPPFAFLIRKTSRTLIKNVSDDTSLSEKKLFSNSVISFVLIELVLFSTLFWKVI